MSELTTELLGRACRIFLEVAFAGRIDQLPASKQVYAELGEGLPLADYLPPAPASIGIAQKGKPRADGQTAYEFRLGCQHYRNLKLRVQTMDFHGQQTWVFMVDTHDAFSTATPIPPADHPDAAEWLDLQRKNAILKQGIEAAFEARGIPTFKGLLRKDLNTPTE